MSKLLLCNVKMNNTSEKTVYESNGDIPASETPVIYPSTAFLEKTLPGTSALSVVLVAKKNASGSYRENVHLCENELSALAEKTKTNISVDVVYTPFSQTPDTHNTLLMEIIDRIPSGAELTLDMTYGPKDLVVVQFAALTFAEKFLSCTVDEIMYGQAEFDGDKITSAKICGMGSLYYMNSIMSRVTCKDPDEAKEMLRVLMRM